ncbi:TorF family putative porin [Yunchengibacter salinarum]|uniref:TorF family putative porin n=1 Tax=Yunchengibacter salinarum TaxID=3133399 RepID=UPI0035B5A016
MFTAVALGAALGAVLVPVSAAGAADNSVAYSGSVGLVSDYRFRGLSLTDEDVALQGSVTASHESGFSLNVWSSSIDDFNGAGTELDFTASYTANLSEDVSWTNGVIFYTFPGGKNTNYWELYSSMSVSVGAGSLGAGVNYNWDQGNIGGQDNIYLSANGSYPLADSGISLNGNIGYEDGAFGNDKVDWGVGFSTSLEGFNVGATLIGAQNAAGSNADTGVVISVFRSF